MAISDKKYDENDPKIKEKLEFLAAFNKETAEKLTCWQDLYDSMGNLARSYFVDPDKESADYVVLMFWSFLLALEALPEEGDVVSLAKKMNEIFLMRSDIHGVITKVGAEAEQEHAKLRLASAALLGALASSLIGDSGVAEESPKDKSKLH